ncbi:MAG: hypothetical protein AABP62_13270 [Planctomycetota bacterium]
MPTVPLPQEAVSVLDRLRSRIRSYVMWEGIALVVVLLGALFWGSFLVDWCYFQLSRLELPRWFRATVLVSGIGLLAAGAVSWIALRLFRAIRIKALALVLERRFPELDDRLITAVEAAEGTEANESPVTSAMLRHTIVEAARTASGLDLGSVFDRKPLRRAVITASVMVASILGLAVANSAAMERWVAGYLGLRDGYWPRETELIVKVIVQPGDRVREFTDGRYKHPKGSDLSLQIEVAPGKKAPEQVRFDARLANGRGNVRAYLTRVGDQPFRHTLAGLLDDADIWVTGGDFVNARPYRVQVVQPPEIQSVTLHCLYPEYTGLNERVEGKPVRAKQQVNGAQTSLPLATDFVLDLIANKPLRHIRIEGDAGTDRWEIELRVPDSTDSASASRPGWSSESISLKSQDGRPEIRVPFPASAARAIWSMKHDAVALPFVLAPDGATSLPAKLRAAAESKQPIEFPLPLPPDAMIRVSLEDTDQIQSTAPAKFTINGIVDQPPLVTTELKGIGSSITRKARVPIAGLLTDDYGVVSARFDYKVDDAVAWSPREFQSTPPRSLREFELRRADEEPFERFDVLPLDLSIKQRLTVTVSALDGCTVGEAHRALGQKYVFNIVSEEELLSMLYVREINIRKRFEQIITEMKQTRELLGKARGQADEAAALKKPGAKPDDEKLATLALGLSSSADRTLQAIRKNSVETAGVETSFADIREELVNNAADTPLLLERLDGKIIAPLHRLNGTDFPNADTSLGLFKLALDKNSDPTGSMDEATDTLESMIDKMEQILVEMRELAKFHEVVEQLKANIKSLQDLHEETKRRRKENAIKALE